MDKVKNNIVKKENLADEKSQEELAKKRYEKLYQKAWLSTDQKPDTDYNRNTTTWD